MADVFNVVARQVGQQVEIVYDLEDADGDLMTVSLQVPLMAWLPLPLQQVNPGLGS